MTFKDHDGELEKLGWDKIWCTFPDPLMALKIDAESWLPGYSRLFFWDPWLFYGMHCDVSIFKCPWCGELSTPQSEIVRRAWRHGLKCVFRMDGRVDLLKVSQYQHKNCKSAKDGKKTVLFSSIHTVFLSQLPPDVAAKFPFMLSNTHTLQST